MSGNSRIRINDDYDLFELLQYQKTRRLNGGIGDGIKTDWSDMETSKYQHIAEDLETLKKRVFGSTGLEYNVQLLRNRTRIVQQILLRYRNTVNEAEKRLQDLFERLQKDNCRSNPCMNAGTCISLFNSFICKCTPQFEVCVPKHQSVYLSILLIFPIGYFLSENYRVSRVIRMLMNVLCTLALTWIARMVGVV